MRFRVRKNGAKFRARQMWHNWFAWHPIRIPARGQCMVWFETVQRKSVDPSIAWEGDICWNYSYRDLV